MPETPFAAARIANGDCLNCGLVGQPDQRWQARFCSDACAIDHREHHGCGDEPAYCGSCNYEKAMFCLFTDGSGAYCGAPKGHDGKHRRRLTPTIGDGSGGGYRIVSRNQGGAR